MGRPKGSGKSFVEWCNENGPRGARLLLECKEKDPSQLTKTSNYKALWKCAEEKCRHKWRAQVNDRTRSDRPCGCPKCGNRIRRSEKTNNFLTWCNAHGERGKRLLDEFCDKVRRKSPRT
jgi:hypothetical protein